MRCVLVCLELSGVFFWFPNKEKAVKKRHSRFAIFAFCIFYYSVFHIYTKEKTMGTLFTPGPLLHNSVHAI